MPLDSASRCRFGTAEETWRASGRRKVQGRKSSLCRESGEHVGADQVGTGGGTRVSEKRNVWALQIPGPWKVWKCLTPNNSGSGVQGEPSKTAQGPWPALAHGLSWGCALAICVLMWVFVFHVCGVPVCTSPSTAEQSRATLKTCSLAG